MKIMKFGGSSVANAARISDVIDIIFDSQKQDKIAVVVSAFQGVTDQLISMSVLASKGNKKYKKSFEQLKQRHLEVSAELSTKIKIDSTLAELEEVLHGVFLVRELTDRTLDFVMGFGERLSASIISAAIRDAEFLDSRTLLKTDQNFGAARVDTSFSYLRIRSYFKKHPALQIITGFIGSSHQGETTTLGRGGSDYTASLFGCALNASKIEIWTDVDGVMTADPRKVPSAFPIKLITYEEAMEMSHFGAKIIHPPTMRPAMSKNIPILIKNTFHPKFKGTFVGATNNRGSYAIKGLSSISDVVLLRVQGTGMIGVPGVSSRLFGALGNKKINVILITQASSEHSICLAIDPRMAMGAKKAIEEEFRLEIKAELIDEVIVEKQLAIIAAVGENMRRTAGIAGRLFMALGNAGINVNAIAQGSSELNVSIVIRKKDESAALNAVHKTFFE
jgi:aspartokinase/homoserine dehydrogenase 1